MRTVLLLAMLLCVGGCGGAARVDLGPTPPPHPRPFFPPPPGGGGLHPVSGVVAGPIATPSVEWTHVRTLVAADRTMTRGLAFANQQFFALRATGPADSTLSPSLELVSHHPATGEAIGGGAWGASDGNEYGDFDAYLAGGKERLFIAANIRGTSDLLPGYVDASVVVCHNAGSTILWTARLNGSRTTHAEWTGLRIVAIAADPQGGVVVAAAKGAGGATNISPSAPAMLIRFNENGVESWRTDILGGRSVAALAIDEKGTIFVGGSADHSTAKPAYLAAFESTAAIQWLRTLGDGIAIRGIAASSDGLAVSASMGGGADTLTWAGREFRGANNPSNHVLLVSDHRGADQDGAYVAGSGTMRTTVDHGFVVASENWWNDTWWSPAMFGLTRYSPSAPTPQYHPLAELVDVRTYDLDGLLAHSDGTFLISGTTHDFNGTGARTWFLRRLHFKPR